MAKSTKAKEEANVAKLLSTEGVANDTGELIKGSPDVLEKVDFGTMKLQIENAKDKSISKEKVLTILHDKLKDADTKNTFVVDRIDGVAIKELINVINQL